MHFEEKAHTKPSSPVCLAAGRGLVHKGFAFSSSESHSDVAKLKAGAWEGRVVRKILSVVTDPQAGRTD